MKRTNVAGVVRPPSDAELSQALQQEKARLRRRGALIGTGEGVVAIVLILAIYGILIGLAVPPSLYVVTVTGGGAATTAQTAFVDDRGLAIFIETLTALTAGCWLPGSNPAMANAKVGLPRAETNAAWAAIMEALAGNITNGTGCQFYGLNLAQSRAGGQSAFLGPVDICQAYVNIGIDLLHARSGFHKPANISAYLNLAYDIAYPLNLFWTNTNDQVFARSQATGRMYLIVQALTQPVANQSAYPINVRGIATEFCNFFFANDDGTYYGQDYMPWLKFPFPGLMPRDGDTVYASQVRRLLNPQTVAMQLANGTALNYTIAGVYIIDEPLQNDTDTLALAVDALFADVPRYYKSPFGGGTARFLQTVANSLQALDNGETIVIVARYARDFNLFNSFNFVRSAGAFPPPLFFLFSNLLTPADNMPVTPANLGLVPLEIQNFATSAQVVNLLDTVNGLTAFDRVYTPEYTREKLVGTFIATAINPILNINMTGTLQLLDTFALKNTVVQGRDLGGHLAALLQTAALDRAGYALGYKPLPLAVEAQVQTVVAPILGRDKRTAPYPANYDYRNGTRGACVRPVFAQGACGESWATAMVAAQSARFCLRGVTRGWANLSMSHIAACAAVPGISNGCEPSHPAVAATFLSTLGAVAEQCYPGVTTAPCDAVPCAPAPCLVNCPGQTYTVFHNTDRDPIYYKVSGVEALKSELYHNGPLVACYDVPVDFYAFFAANPNGCYANDTAPAYGGDCAVVVAYYNNTLILRSGAGTGFAHRGDFCVAMTPGRLRGSAWFANEAWAAQIGGTTRANAQTVPIPAGTDRTPSLIVSPPTTTIEITTINR
jgi:hypothetical protein